jgi:S-(hydroxymethyl)glutathione dehydrogenase/alcohol dehydrogenase
MRAAVLRETGGPLAVEDVDLAPPGRGEVCVALHASGVCHSDWNTVTGDAPSPLPTVLGHEGAGVVESLGPGVTSVAPGGRVVLSWMPSCGACFYCLQGRPVLCEEAASEMLSGALPGGARRLSLDGRPLHHYSFLSTFAGRAVVPEESCVPLPDGVPFPVAALLGCAIMTGFGAVVNAAHVAAGSTVAIFGTGGVGLAAVQAARLAGATAIVAVDPLPSRRELALELGATHALDPDREDAAAALRELTAGRGADYALETAGREGLAAAAYETIRPGGTLVCVGIPPAGALLSLPAADVPRDEKVLVGSLYGSCRPHVDMPLVLDLYRAGRLALDRLVSAPYRLEDVNEAFADMRAGRVARAVIELSEEDR